MKKEKIEMYFKKALLNLPNEKGELIVCNDCDKAHDIRRRSIMICACGNIIKSKQYDKDWFKDYLAHEL